METENTDNHVTTQSEAPTATEPTKKPFYKRMLKFLMWIIGIWVALLLIIQIILSPSVLTRIVNKVAAGYVDGNVSFGKAQVSVFRHFPRITVSLEDVCVTYPSDRYDSLEQISTQGMMLYSGTGESSDTLASFSRLSASISLSALAIGDIKLTHINLDHPRVFGHVYGNGQANWDIFGNSSSAEEPSVTDTTKSASSPPPASASGSTSSGPDIIIGDVRLTGHPHIVYTSSQDTLFAMISLKSLEFDGKVNINKLHKAKVGLYMDSLFIAGRSRRDTLGAGIDMLHIHDHGDHMLVHANAKTFMGTRAFGRMMVPIDISGTVSIPEDSVLAVSVRNLKANIAALPISGNADLRMGNEKTSIAADIAITECHIQDIFTDYLMRFIPELEKVDTDARITLYANATGDIDPTAGTLPKITADLLIPESHITYHGLPDRLALTLNAHAEMDSTGVLSGDINKAAISTSGLRFNASGKGFDILGDDPLMDIDAHLAASLDTLQIFIPDEMGITASGRVDADIAGSARLSHLDIYNFSKADLQGALNGSHIIVTSPEDSLDININEIGVTIGPKVKTSTVDPTQKYRLLTISGNIDNAKARYGSAFSFNGDDIRVSAMNSTEKSLKDTSRIGHLGGTLSAGLLNLEDSKGTTIKMEDTKNNFQMVPKEGQPQVPILSVNSVNKRITYITPVNRAILTDSEIHAQAALTTVEKRLRRQAFMDSLAKVYPFVPKDSLFRHHMQRERRNINRTVPKWMSDDEFKKKDINIKLDETMARYFREWDINAQAKIRTGIIMTPYFPLRNIIRGFECNVTNNEVRIDSLTVMTGQSSSEITAKGKVSGLKRALQGRGVIDVDLELTSDRVDADELLAAAESGSRFKPDSTSGRQDISNADFLKQVKADTVKTAKSEPALIVLPANVNADLAVRARNLTYTNLEISEFTADVKMKERCAQITNTSLLTNMGDIHFNGFYSTQTMKDLKTGFSLDLVDITADRVIAMIPEADKILPMLNSIKGELNCEIAATADLDPNMHIIANSINGIVRLNGNDLSVTDDKLFTEFAKKLFFKNKNEGRIESMNIEGMIKDNNIEIFPFVLKLDRYTLAASGIQNLDMSFKHHVSVLRSPLLIRIGVDLSGPDYDDLKFKIGRAKYKNVRVPDFSAVVDEAKDELLTAIFSIFDNGVRETITRNSIDRFISEHKSTIGYINAAETEIEELSDNEQQKMADVEESQNVIQAAMEASVVAVEEILNNK